MTWQSTRSTTTCCSFSVRIVASVFPIKPDLLEHLAESTAIYICVSREISALLKEEDTWAGDWYRQYTVYINTT